MDIEYIKSNWCTKRQDANAGIDAWDSVAESYVYDPKINFEKDSFLRFVDSKITLTKDMRVLDVGCGAGAYSMALAERVGHVDGVDYSPKMISLAEQYAREHSIDNVRFLERDWHNCDADKFKATYDVVIAHTTPAIVDYASFSKMAAASKKYCFFCVPARRTDQVFDELKRLAGIKPSTNDAAVAYAFSTIWNSGCNPEMQYDETTWHSEMTVNEAHKWYVSRLKERCALDKDLEGRLREHLRNISKIGLVSEEIKTTLVSFFWSVT